jgi:hypothetical protein
MDRSRACGAQERKEGGGACRLESGGPAPVACGEPSMCVTTERDSLLCSPLLAGPIGLPSHTRPPRHVACRPGILRSLSLYCLHPGQAALAACLLLWAAFTCHAYPKYFLFHPSHRIFRRMHEALNVDKKITNYIVCL